MFREGHSPHPNAIFNGELFLDHSAVHSVHDIYVSRRLIQENISSGFCDIIKFEIWFSYI